MDAVTQMRQIADKQCFISGMTGVVTDIKNLCLHELPIYVVIAVLCCLLILELTSTSFLVPILFLISIGAAIVYNLGSNIFFGRNVLYYESADCDFTVRRNDGLFHFPFE